MQEKYRKRGAESVVLDSLGVLVELDGFSSDGNCLKKSRWFRLRWSGEEEDVGEVCQEEF